MARTNQVDLVASEAALPFVSGLMALPFMYSHPANVITSLKTFFLIRFVCYMFFLFFLIVFF